MERKRVHLIANAHLDPVWLWRWEEGCTEALSTFRTAADLLETYEEFKFNHNEAILYEWVKDNDKELFERIKELVKKGRWEIIGGWYLQPDCNMPAGESMVRNIMLGRQFFKDNFDACPTTAVNFDSFGHSKGLVQIMRLAGYDTYLVFRPDQKNYDFPDADFIWEGLGGYEITVHRSDEGYNSIWGQAADELSTFLEKRTQEEVTLFLWGVGDHGGGPTREDLNDFRELIEKHEYEIIHSTPHAYFADLREKKPELYRVDRSLNPVAPGCYTSQIRVKQKHRQLENDIYEAEKMASAAAILYNRPYHQDIFAEAVKSLVFAQFHDALPGTGTKLVEEDTLRLLEHGLELMSREKIYAAIALASGEPGVVTDTSTIMIYNPHPFDITGDFECEVGLPKQNWSKDFMYPEVNFKGTRIPTQGEKECSNFGIDWRKKVVVHATLKASSMNRMDVYFKPLEKRPVFDDIISSDYYNFKNQNMSVKINVRTGLLDEYTVDGRNYLGAHSFTLRMTDDTYNSWGFGDNSTACQRDFQLLTPHEGSYFSGLRNAVIPSVRIIEDGEVRTVIEAVFGLCHSAAYIRYKLPKEGTAFEVEVMVQFNEKEQNLKLMLHTPVGDNVSVQGQIMFGREEIKTNGQEEVAQKWTMVSDKDTNQSLLVINNGTYGLRYKDKQLGITLLRAAGYAAADDVAGKALMEKQYAPRMEQGERLYSFVVDGGMTHIIEERADNQALVFNEKPYAFAYCPPGTGVKKDGFLKLDNAAIVVSAIKKAEKSDDFVLRLYESTGKEQETIVEIGELRIWKKVGFHPFEIKTFVINLQNEELEETSIIEGM